MGIGQCCSAEFRSCLPNNRDKIRMAPEMESFIWAFGIVFMSMRTSVCIGLSLGFFWEKVFFAPLELRYPLVWTFSIF
jgi:hypothetical protein